MIIQDRCIFQSTLPHGERHNDIDKPEKDDDFNPRSHTGSDIGIWDIITYYANFNPRSHTGSDSVFIDSRVCDDISIHAPTRGATQLRHQILVNNRYFNPRSHTGSDSFIVVLRVLFDISIHAPTRGATILYFVQQHIPIFQSTLPHGERHSFNCDVEILIDFNPRSHTGSDPEMGIEGAALAISIHAPTRGATAILYKNFAYFHSYVTIINIHCISMHPFANA